MKNGILLLMLLAGMSVQAQIRIPSPSSAGSVSSVIGLTDVKIDYSRPKMKGRKIFGEGAEYLTPYGQIWRTGANNGSVISFSDDVKVEGHDVPKGEYLIFTWPGATEWTVSLYKDLSLGGNTGGYDESKEQVRFKVKPTQLAEKIETMTFDIADISEDNTSGNVQLSWENTSVKFKVTADFDKKVMESIEANTKVNPSNLITAAHYYYDTKRDLKQALAWVNEYLAIPANSKQFWQISFKAQIQKALGDKAGALATAKQSLELAKAADGDFGYIKINEDLIKSLK